MLNLTNNEHNTMSQSCTNCSRHNAARGGHVFVIRQSCCRLFTEYISHNLMTDRWQVTRITLIISFTWHLSVGGVYQAASEHFVLKVLWRFSVIQIIFLQEGWIWGNWAWLSIREDVWERLGRSEVSKLTLEAGKKDLISGFERLWQKDLSLRGRKQPNGGSVMLWETLGHLDT